MATDRLRVEGNERMDLADFQFALGDQTLANHRQLLSQLICSPARERKWVLSGFAITSPTGTQVQVAKGRGLFAEIRSGEAHYGILTTEGDATKIVDINTYPTGLYGIYVRFEEVEGSFQPRIFWNASGLGSEYTETVATRYLASWSVRVEATDPGDEWLQIGTVNRADMALVDMRDFYFEGPVDGSYASGWSTDGGGSANDRSADRKTYGVTDFQEFSAATRQCLEDIKGRGLRRWWARDIGGMNLGFDAAPTEDRLALGDANFFLDGGTNKRWQFDTDDHLTYNRTGNVLTLAIGSASHIWGAVSQSPGATNTVDLGTPDKRYANLYLAGSIDSSGTVTAGTAFLPDTDGGANLGASDKYFLKGYVTEQFTSILRPPATKVPYQIDVYGDFVAASTNTIGVTGTRWANGFFSTVTTDTIKSTSLTIKSETDGDVNVYARGAILPVSSQSLNIGSATAGDRIDNGYFDTLNVYLGFSVVDDKVTSNLIPDVATRTLGRIGLRWEGFFGNLAMNIGTVYTRLVADEHLGADLGTNGNYFANGYVANLISTSVYTSHLYDLFAASVSVHHSLLPAGGGIAVGNFTSPFSSVTAAQIWATHTAPVMGWYDTNGTTDEKFWQRVADGDSMYLRAMDDGNSGYGNIERFERSGTSAYIHEIYSIWFRPSGFNTHRCGDIARPWMYVTCAFGFLIENGADCGGASVGWDCYTGKLSTCGGSNDLHVHGSGSGGTGNFYWLKFYVGDTAYGIPLWNWTYI